MGFEPTWISPKDFESSVSTVPPYPQNWASWIRTSECISQGAVPYRLAIAHCRGSCFIFSDVSFNPPLNKLIYHIQLWIFRVYDKFYVIHILDFYLITMLLSILLSSLNILSKYMLTSFIAIIDVISLISAIRTHPFASSNI